MIGLNIPKMLWHSQIRSIKLVLLYFQETISPCNLRPKCHWMKTYHDKAHSYMQTSRKQTEVSPPPNMIDVHMPDFSCTLNGISYHSKMQKSCNFHHSWAFSTLTNLLRRLNLFFLSFVFPFFLFFFCFTDITAWCHQCHSLACSVMWEV